RDPEVQGLPPRQGPPLLKRLQSLDHLVGVHAGERRSASAIRRTRSVSAGVEAGAPASSSKARSNPTDPRNRPTSWPSTAAFPARKAASRHCLTLSQKATQVSPYSTGADRIVAISVSMSADEPCCRA